MKLLDNRNTRIIIALISFLVAYGFYNLSVDRGNLWWYLFTLVFVYLGFRNLFKGIDSKKNNGKNRSTK